MSHEVDKIKENQTKSSNIHLAFVCLDTSGLDSSFFPSAHNLMAVDSSCSGFALGYELEESDLFH